MTRPTAFEMNVVYDWMLTLTNEELILAWDRAGQIFDNDIHLGIFRHQLFYTVQQLQTGRWIRGVPLHDQTFIVTEVNGFPWRGGTTFCGGVEDDN